MVACGYKLMKVRMRIDYKSIALPAELQGHLVSCDGFSIKDHISQRKKRSLYCSHASHARRLVGSCDLIVTCLSASESVFESVWDFKSYLLWDFTTLRTFITTNIWSGKNESDQIYKTESR